MIDARKAADVLAYKLGCEGDAGKVTMIEMALTEYAKDQYDWYAVNIAHERELAALEARDAIVQRLLSMRVSPPEHDTVIPAIRALTPEQLTPKKEPQPNG